MSGLTDFNEVIVKMPVWALLANATNVKQSNVDIRCNSKGTEIEVDGQIIPVLNKDVFADIAFGTTAKIGVIVHLPKEIEHSNLTLSQPFTQVGRNTETELSFFVLNADGGWLSWRNPEAQKRCYFVSTLTRGALLTADVDAKVAVGPLEDTMSQWPEDQAEVIADFDKGVAAIIRAYLGNNQRLNGCIMDFEEGAIDILSSGFPIAAAFAKKPFTIDQLEKSATTRTVALGSKWQSEAGIDFALFGSSDPNKQPCCFVNHGFF